MLNIKDSRFYYDKKGYRAFSEKNIVIPQLESEFNLDGENKNDFVNINPPYTLLKNQNSGTIWIFRQFFGDTLYMKIDTIDNNELFIKDLKKIFTSLLSVFQRELEE